MADDRDAPRLTEAEQDLVIGRLAEGFGAEDIHVTDGLPEDAIRAFIAEMRANGTLREIYRDE